MYDLILAAKSDYKKKKGQSSAGTLLAILVFLSSFAFIIAGIFHHNTPLLILNPIVLGGIIAAFGVAILAGNTAPAGVGGRGIALAAMMLIAVPALFIDFVNLGVPLPVTAIVIAPITIVFSYIILESSKG